MPLDTFTPPKDPSPRSAGQVKPRTNTAQFGDGYSQRSEDGLNALTRDFQAVWPGLTVADRDTITAFLANHTVTPFLWTVPLESVEYKWIAVDWSPGAVGGEAVSLSATLRVVFDL